MDSAIVTATWQAAALSGLSNILGQAIKCYRANRPFTLNTIDLAHFILYAILSTPPNFMWQAWLEKKFPAKTTTQPPPKKTDDVQFQQQPSLNKTNTAIKFALDQTLGATVNTILFLLALPLMRGQSLDAAMTHCKESFWPIMIAGQKLWPMVSIFNFTIVPVEYRTVVGSLVGLFWGVYLSLISSSK